jgi:hypothetical protein
MGGRHDGSQAPQHIFLAHAALAEMGLWSGKGKTKSRQSFGNNSCILASAEAFTHYPKLGFVKLMIATASVLL